MHSMANYDNVNIFVPNTNFVPRKIMFEGLAIKEIFCEEAVKIILSIEALVAASDISSIKKEPLIDKIGNHLDRLDNIKKIGRVFLVQKGICGKNYFLEKQDHIYRVKIKKEVSLMLKIEKIEEKIEELEIILQEGPDKLIKMKNQLNKLREEQAVIIPCLKNKSKNDKNNTD